MCYKNVKQFRLENELEDMKIEFLKIYKENESLKSKINQFENERQTKLADDFYNKNKMYDICAKFFTKNQVDIMYSTKEYFT